MKNILIPLVVMFAVSGYSVIANAQGAAGDNPTLSERAQFRAGPFFANIDSSVEIEDTDFDLDDQLGENQTTIAVEGFIRLSRRLRINVGYFGVDREETETLSEPLKTGPIDLPAGTELSSDYKNTSISGGLGWAFLKSDTTELGADINVSIVTIESRVAGTVPGFPTVNLSDIDITEPMPSYWLVFSTCLFSPVVGRCTAPAPSASTSAI